MIQDAQKFDFPSRELYKLDRMKTALEALGHPERGRDCVLITGTNGKGSLCYYWTKLAQLMGFKVGSFVSPHIYERGERIQIDSVPSSEDELSSLEAEYADILEPLTYFERMTALAFLRFKNEKVDLQVIEVGIGGRLDATNLCEPNLSLLTSVGFDHQNVLGPTLKDIAWEKFGVSRSGKALWVASDLPLDIFAEMKIWSQEAGVVLKSCPRELGQSDWEQALRENFSDRGEHQLRNLRLAILSFFDFLREKKIETPSLDKVIRSLKEVRVPARLERRDFAGPWLIDGAHNPSAIEALRSYVEEQMEDVLPFDGIFGCMGDKDWKKVLGPLRDSVRNLYLPSFFPEREMPPAKLKEEIEKEGWFKGKLHLVPNLDHFLQERAEKDFPVLVFGSFYLTGHVLSEMRRWEQLN